MTKKGITGQPEVSTTVTYPLCTLNRIVTALVILATLVILPPALAGTETLITTNTTGSDQQAPYISGQWIVWEDYRNNDWDIYGYNLVTGEERRITPDGAIAHDPVLSDDRVAWQDYRDGNYDIFVNNLVTGIETQITDDRADQTAPAIDGDMIVWQDLRSGYSDIYRYDFKTLTEALVSSGAPGVNKNFPAISGNLVVWQDDRNNPSRTDIFMNDTVTGKLYNLTPSLISSNQMKPAISGTRVVWKEEKLTGNGNIWMNDTAVALMDRIDNGPAYARKNRPVVSGSRVVWMDTRNRAPSFYDLYLNNTITGQNIRVTTDDAEIRPWEDAGIGYGVMGPSVSGTRIVWTDERNGNRDIFLYTDGVPESCPVAGFTPSAQSGSLPFTVDFSDTTIPGTTPVSHWRWEFGDGNTSTEQTPSFTYNVPGNYMVRLTVGNALCRNETPVTGMYNISVGVEPVAIFTTDPEYGLTPLTVSFTDSSAGATAWNWSFGDGTYSELQNPSHALTAPGTYTVVLNASNVFGSSTTSRDIHARESSGSYADTTIDGITVAPFAGMRHLIYDTSLLPGYSLTGGRLVCTDPVLGAHGWQKITFRSDDGIGFVPSGTTIRGNITSVVFSSSDIYLDSAVPGSGRSVNFSTTLTSYPSGGTLHTQVWSGALPVHLEKFRKIATQSNFLAGRHPAYTINITKTGFPAGPAIIHFSADSDWVDHETDGRNHIYLIRVADDGNTGEVMPAVFLYEDSGQGLDFFETRSPRGFSTLGVTTLSGSGNPFQLITLSVASHVNSPSAYSNPASGSDNDMNPAPGTSAGTVAAPVYTTPLAGTSAPVPADIFVTSAKVYANAQGIVTQATRLRSSDGRAEIIIPEGIVAKDAGGNPLETLTLRVLPSGDLPPIPSGSVFVFDGLAYEIGPDGATFSPPVSLSFAPVQPQWGRDYAVRSFEKTTGTWQEMTASFDGSTGIVTAQVPHLCIFALFTEPRAGTPVLSTTTLPLPAAPQQAKAQPPSSAVSIFMNMMGWAGELLMNNLVIVVAAVILAVAAFLVRKGRMPGSWG